MNVGVIKKGYIRLQIDLRSYFEPQTKIRTYMDWQRPAAKT